MASNDKTIVLITGGNGGVGYLTAEALAASSPNYHVIITSRNLEKGEKALEDLQKSQPKESFSLVKLDVTDHQTITDAASQVSKEFGHIDVLINNAGIISKATLLINQLREVFETNTFGPAIVTESFLPLLEKSKDARLIYVTSDLGSITERSDPSGKYYKLPAVSYRMSKSALNMLAMCHHAELGPKGVKVWTFNPGYVVTNLSGTGEAGRQERIKNGAGDAKESAEGILKLVDGRRDQDVGKFVNKDGIHPW
ncbi:NAD(P)-binding protein [Mollisia scopiformis]|uniref:NAD(P)-binding protein n=1 Tax=Mollisia scopiformis TaxID=149040 RepID=A0A132BBC1_MOLSC|nr:NAD(P)-binding protein [Mollisia scopiformis]KUJ09722.1 NAD(P)-binding protein [Mollisia scopiformis]